jgi:hypothetical protein
MSANPESPKIAIEVGSGTTLSALLLNIPNSPKAKPPELVEEIVNPSKSSPASEYNPKPCAPALPLMLSVKGLPVAPLYATVIGSELKESGCAKK